MRCRNSAPGPFTAQVLPFFNIDPVGLLMVDEPALAPEQHLNSLKAKPYPGLGNLEDPFAFGPVIAGMMPVIIRRPMHPNQAGYPTNTRPIGMQQVLDQFTSLTGS